MWDEEHQIQLRKKIDHLLMCAERCRCLHFMHVIQNEQRDCWMNNSSYSFKKFVFSFFFFLFARAWIALFCHTIVLWLVLTGPFFSPKRRETFFSWFCFRRLSCLSWIPTILFSVDVLQVLAVVPKVWISEILQGSLSYMLVLVQKMLKVREAWQHFPDG